MVDLFVANSGSSRFGVIVPRHGRNIVARNRLKRRLKEIGRRRLLTRSEETGTHVEVLARARPNAYEAPYGALEYDLTSAMEPEWVD